VKVLLLTDTHWGMRGDNVHFYDYQKKFLDNVVFPYIKRFDIKRMFHLGDLVDNRKTMNYQTLTRMREDFLNPLAALNIETDWIPGNHDSFYRNNININAMKEFVTVGKVYDAVESITVDGARITIVPWICADTYDQSVTAIRASTDTYAFGHLELKGFPNNNGLPSVGGEDRVLFNNFGKVLSGHFHKRSRQDNVHYLGSCFQSSWSDYGDFRGMSVFDTSDGSITYFRNPYSIFSVVELDRINDDGLPPLVNKTYCRLVVREAVKEPILKAAVKKIEDCGVISLTIDDSSIMIAASPEKPQEGESLHSLIMRHIDSLQLDNLSQVKIKFDDLYTRASQK
jgi:DNA repair exonuclease SbcCD nuclease subunit